jgi:putative DNA methylase
LATCRAVLFASLVDDPTAWPELFPTEEEQENERKRLFEIIEQLVKWENSNNDTVLLMAQTEIARSISRNLEDEMPEGAEAIRKYLAERAPPVLDPFCGGGSIPLEAQRLGLRAYGSDLNPVAVLITKALIEIPPKFEGLPPVNPEARQHQRLMEKEWNGAEGLAEDVRYYGKWMRDEAEKRIGDLYPKVKVTKEMAKERPELEPYVGQELTVIAWLWARTVPSPNPACGGAGVPLIGSFWLSKKKGQEAFVQPVVDTTNNSYCFRVVLGKPPSDFDPSNGTKVGRATFACILSGAVISGEYIDKQANAGNLKSQPLAIVAEGNRSRVYLSPNSQPIQKCVEQAGLDLDTSKIPNEPSRGTFASNAQGRVYGFFTFGDYFSSRQLLSLVTFSGLVHEARDQLLVDLAAGRTLPDDERRLEDGGFGPTAYADAICTYLAFGVDKLSDRGSMISSWDTGYTKIRNTFGRQGIPMTWCFAEVNPFSSSTGNWLDSVEWGPRYLDRWFHGPIAHVQQLDATVSVEGISSSTICTDPPYYDNIVYSDLSDFFYVWLRRSIGHTYPQLFSTLLTPKTQELMASPYRHEGNRDKARDFFEEQLGKAFRTMRKAQSISFPLVVYYAFRQAEASNKSMADPAVVSTGWETMLSGLIKAGLRVCGTWPIRSELTNRVSAAGANSLASSIVLVCRPRMDSVPLATRREFLSSLKQELPAALTNLQHGNIAPVDLAQASIGPGMAVFTRYSKVMESNGSSMSVRTALGLINQTLGEVLAEQEGEFDPDTRWAIAWFEQFGIEEGPFGVAETLSKAKDTAVHGLVDAGILEAGSGKVRLLKRDELLQDWDPAKDKRFTAWEATQYLIRALDQQGEQGAAALLRKLGGGHGETARDLAYRLYNICERKGWASEALAYNSLVIAWPELTRLAQVVPSINEAPQTSFDDDE